MRSCCLLEEEVAHSCVIEPLIRKIVVTHPPLLQVLILLVANGHKQYAECMVVYVLKVGIVLEHAKVLDF